MMEHLAILGRQHEIGIAELESLYGPGSIMPINKHACFIEGGIDFARIGSSSKQARFLETIHASSVADAISHSLPHIVKIRKGKTGKLQLGISVFGHRSSPGEINRAALTLKKKLRSKGLSVRLIPNKNQELNAAQILRNKLTKENGIEINLIFDGKQVHIAQTTDVQDIDEYTHRDLGKPVRDPLVGMLPPKLAQTLINLANAKSGDHLLDPFCGTGTVLIEAFAMGINSVGSDISPEMVDASRVNLKWFVDTRDQPTYAISMADATTHDWESPINSVACETYLGPALHVLPDEKLLLQTIKEVDDIHRCFLQNLAAQIKSGTRVCLAIPAWHKQGKFYDLPVLDDLEKLGYNPSSFVHTSGEQLIYHRPHQVVGRRILSLSRAN